MRIDTWTSGYKIEACDWYDGKHIYFCVSYYKPRMRLSASPALERSILIDKGEEHKVTQYTDSIARAVISEFAGLKGKSAFPLLSEYRNGKQTIENGKELTA